MPTPENDYRSEKELLRTIAKGVEELLSRPGHCSVNVTGTSPSPDGIPANLRQLWQPGFQGEHQFQVTWNHDGPYRRETWRMTLEAHSLVLALEVNGWRAWWKRIYFDGPDINLT